MKHLALLFASLVVLTSWAGEAQPQDPSAQLPDILTDTFRYDINTPSVIDIHELIAGCPRRDCIPSIDDPQFDSILNTDYLSDNDLLMVVEHSGIIHAYPHSVLSMHEVVNDQFGKTPIVVTYCPLCASGVAFIAQVGGLVSDFGVSGMLHNSDLVLYDRRTNHLWGQITGEAIVGPNAGAMLQRVPVRTITWANVKAHYPRAAVLQPDLQTRTRLNRPNGKSRYDDYAKSTTIRFPVSHKDATRHPKQLVYGINLNGSALAITADYLKKHPVSKEIVGGHEVHIRRHRDGSVTAINIDTKKPVPVTRVYWFAWYTFHTGTVLVD